MWNLLREALEMWVEPPKMHGYLKPIEGRLKSTDPVGWYLCKLGEQFQVLHWDGKEMDDVLPHRNSANKTDWNLVIDDCQGPMCFVDLDFPGD